MSEAETVATLQDQQLKGDRAKSAIDAWQEAYDATKADLLAEFEATRFDEGAKRERIYDSMRVLNHMHQFLKRRAITGEAARKQLLDIRDPSKLRRLISAK